MGKLEEDRQINGGVSHLKERIAPFKTMPS